MGEDLTSNNDSEETVMNIELSEEDAEGQFERLADELALSASQREEVREDIMSIVEDRTAGEDIAPEKKEWMANIMASTIRQELNQLEQPVSDQAVLK